MLTRQQLARACRGAPTAPRAPPRPSRRRAVVVAAVEHDPEGLFKGLAPKTGIIERRLMMKQMETADSEFKKVLNMAGDEDRKVQLMRRESRKPPEDHHELIEYFLNTQADDMEFEVARCRPALTAEFFKTLDALLGAERFAAKPDEDRLAELDTLRQYLEEGAEAVDKAVAANVSAVERMKALLSAADKKAKIRDMAAANEIDAPLMDLLQQNIDAARAAGQEAPAEFMEKATGPLPGRWRGVVTKSRRGAGAPAMVTIALLLAGLTGLAAAQAGAEAGAAACAVRLKAWDQCGGKSGCAAAGAGGCGDAPWAGRCCPAGAACVRNNEYYYNCQPGSGTAGGSGTAPAGQPAATPPAAPAPAPAPGPPVAARRRANGEYDYGQVLNLSMMFYEAQRSGKLPRGNRIPWRGDSGLNHRAADGRDVTGGWYDAGDNVKFNLPMAWSAAVLAWGVVEFEAGYKSAGALDAALANVRWAADYFVKCVGNGSSVVVQVGNGAADHAVWGRPEDVAGPVPVYEVTPSAPGSDAVGAMAAALAAASEAFRRSDPAYSAKLLASARTAYTFASTHLGSYSDAVPDAAAFYRSSNFYDDLAYAAAWLALRTGEPGFKGSDLVTFTPRGLAYSGPWGSLRHAGNAAFLMKAYARADAVDCAVRDTLGYMLGDGGRSFVVGYGTNPPTRPHHRASSCPALGLPCSWDAFNSPGPNPHTLYGALVGGPGPADDYVDARGDFIKNEVATDYNAGFSGALAAAAQGLRCGTARRGAVGRRMLA
ncbi:celF [Scenedesmus sp. PABB004]|nr:celF [Scenedesmus sp. PABB004]